jgi:hypothetical protein
MGRQSLQFSLAHPDPSPGYATMVGRLQERLDRCDVLADQQKAGLAGVAAASARKLDLRRRIDGGHLKHIVKVAQLAAIELPELAKTFVLPVRSASYLDFVSRARTIAAEAAEHRELLLKYGLVESVLDDLNASIAQFEEAVEQGTAARRQHIAASAELSTALAEAMKIITALDGVNRVRFADDPEQLVVWRNAINIVRPVRSQGQPPAGKGEVQPAA